MNEKPSFHYVISFPDFEPSDAVRADIEKYLAKLEQVFSRIISCNVFVRAPHMSKRKHIYHINLHLEIPGEDIIVNHEPEKNMAHMDIHVAIRDAFNSLHRQLRKRVKSMQKKTTPPDETHQYAIIKSFDIEEGYGFLTDPSGREIYFHKNSILNSEPSEVKPGLRVRFAEEMGEKGTQVTSMSLL